MRSLGTKSLILVTVMVVAAATLKGVEPDWPHFRGPNYDGVPSGKTLVATTLTKVWEASVHTGFSSVSIVENRLYTMGNREERDVVTCIDIADGRVVWDFDYPCKLDPNLYEGGPSATPTVDQGRVFTISKFGHIFCLDAQSGAKVWEASAESYRPATKRWWGFAGSPTVIGDVVIFNVGGHGLALNKKTGSVVWSSDPGTIAYCSIIPLPESLLNRPAIVVLTNDTIRVLDPARGEQIADVESPFKRRANCNAVTPVVWDGELYVTDAGAGMSRLSLEETTFKSRWLQRKPAMSWHTFNHRVFHKGRIYFLARKGGLFGLDAEDGEVVSQEEDYRFGNLLVVGDTLVMLDETGQLVWGNLANGKFQETARQKILDGRCWAYPVLHGRQLYARDAKGTLGCFEFDN